MEVKPGYSYMGFANTQGSFKVAVGSIQVMMLTRLLVKPTTLPYRHPPAESTRRDWAVPQKEHQQLRREEIEVMLYGLPCGTALVEPMAKGECRGKLTRRVLALIWLSRSLFIGPIPGNDVRGRGRC